MIFGIRSLRNASSAARSGRWGSMYASVGVVAAVLRSVVSWSMPANVSAQLGRSITEWNETNGVSGARPHTCGGGGVVVVSVVRRVGGRRRVLARRRRGRRVGHVGLPRPAVRDELVGERQRRAREHAARAEHLALLLRVRALRARVHVVVRRAAGERVGVRPLAADQRDLVGERAAGDRVVVGDQLALLRQVGREVGRLGARAERVVVLRGRQDDQEQVLDVGQLRAARHDRRRSGRRRRRRRARTA